MAVFDEYARYYDLLYRDKDYGTETAFIVSLLKKFAPQAEALLELGCGTGIHAKMLAEAGYNVTGVDFSESMLISAKQRKHLLPLKLQTRLELYQGDARTFRADKQFDVVISLFHVFSYQTSNADLQAAFQTAAEHLKPGGILIFDYWYGPAVLTQRPETRVKRLQDGDMVITRIAESNTDTLRNTVEVNYETTVRVQDSTEVVRESHLMRYLFVPEIELLSAIYGFDSIAHQEWLGNRAPSTDSWAAFSVLRRADSSLK